MNLVSETLVIFRVLFKHLVCLIKNKHFNFFEIQVPLLNHIEDSAWGTTDHMNSHLQFTNVLLHGLTTKTCMNLNVEMVS